MNWRNFFAELKRRNVFRAATFYAASAWLLVQVATQLFLFFPDCQLKLVRWIIVAAAIRFAAFIANVNLPRASAETVVLRVIDRAPLSAGAGEAGRDARRFFGAP